MLLVKDIIFLTLEQVIVIHDDQIERYGGSHGISRFELLESAVMRPRASFGGRDLYPSIFDKAAAMMHSLIMNHAFVDGNKRTGTASTIILLELNGYKLQVDQQELVDAALNVRYKKWGIKKLAIWLKKHSTRTKK